jgi:hypothetical protein
MPPSVTKFVAPVLNVLARRPYPDSGVTPAS